LRICKQNISVGTVVWQISLPH